MVAKNIILCILGTIGFSVLLNMPKQKLWMVVLGGAISGGVYEILNAYTTFNQFWCTIMAMIALEAYSEAMARILKTPAFIILLPSTIPLLPGGYLFYTMQSILSKDTTAFLENAKQTVLVAFGIAMGSVVMLITLSIIRQFTKR